MAKKEKVRKVIGMVAMVLGGLPFLYSLWEMIGEVPNMLHNFSILSLLVFTFMLLIMIGLPGLLIYCGWNLFRRYSELNLSMCFGVLFGLLGFYVGPVILEFSYGEEAGAREIPYYQSYKFLFLLAAVLAYLFSMRSMVHYFSGEKRRLGDYLSMWVALGMAFMLWPALSELYSVLCADITSPTNPFLFLLPILLTYLAYFYVSKWARFRERYVKCKRKDGEMLDLESDA